MCQTMANLKLNYVTENVLDDWFYDNVEITIIFNIFVSIMMEKQTFTIQIPLHIQIPFMNS